MENGASLFFIDLFLDMRGHHIEYLRTSEAIAQILLYAFGLGCLLAVAALVFHEGPSPGRLAVGGIVTDFKSGGVPELLKALLVPDHIRFEGDLKQFATHPLRNLGLGFLREIHIPEDESIATSRNPEAELAVCWIFVNFDIRKVFELGGIFTSLWVDVILEVFGHGETILCGVPELAEPGVLVLPQYVAPPTVFSKDNCPLVDDAFRRLGEGYVHSQSPGQTLC